MVIKLVTIYVPFKVKIMKRETISLLLVLLFLVSLFANKVFGSDISIGPTINNIFTSLAIILLGWLIYIFTRKPRK